MRAITWSLRTRSLKSTSTSVTWPEIWLPTSTVEIALSVPVAEIATRRSPRSTAAVRNPPSAAAALRCVHHQARPARTTSATTVASVREDSGNLLDVNRRDVRVAGRVGAIRGSFVGDWGRERAPAGGVDPDCPKDSANELDGRKRSAAGHAFEDHRPAESFPQAAHHRQAQAHATDVLVGAVERVER